MPYLEQNLKAAHVLQKLKKNESEHEPHVA